MGEQQIAPLYIWGAGALGGRVGALWPGAVIGFTRTGTRHAELRALGIEPQVGDPLGLLAAAQAQPAGLLLALPGHEVQGEAIAQLRGMTPPRRAVLISTTGYYGTKAGRLDETTPPSTAARAQSIAAVEADFRAWAGNRGVILRMGGLYGPDRGPFAALRRRGTTRAPVVPDRTLPLIHYDDAATAVLAALQRSQVAPLYLGVTPPCPTRAEFYAAACAKLKIALPAYAPPLGVPPATYSVDLLRRDLLPEPMYPDWRAVLSS